MKILCIQSSSVFEQYGGVEYYQDDLLRSLASIVGSQNVTSVIPKHGPKHGDFLRQPDGSYRVEIVPSQSTGQPSGQSGHQLIRWRRRLENRFPLSLLGRAFAIGRTFKPDLIICGHVSLGPVAFALSNLLRAPYATIVYGIDAWGDLYPQDEWCLKKAASIISISRWTKEILVNRGYRPNGIHVAHPIIAPDLVNTVRVAKPHDPFTLLTISRLDASERYKGHDDTLETIAQMRKQGSLKRKIKYVIQGGGSDKPRLIQKVAELGLTDCVFFLNPTEDRNELKQLYADADIFVMPSRFGKWDNRWRGEGFGIVYAEAGALGVPSLAYRCGGATDIIEHGQTGYLVEPDNLAQLKHSIEYCMEHPEIVEKLGKNAQLRVNSHFTSVQLTESLKRFLTLLGPVA